MIKFACDQDMNDSRNIPLDIFRGIIVILMVFILDFQLSGLRNLYDLCNTDLTGGLGWIPSGFLFAAGMSIPYATRKRGQDGQDYPEIARHIIIRTIGLLIIGILMINSNRLVPELTGFGRNLWSILMYIGIFLTWNDYNDKEGNIFTITGFRLAGMALLTFLVFRFQSGEQANEGSLITGSWGVTGIIGWGYVISALIYLVSRENPVNASIAVIFFLTINILHGYNLLTLPGQLGSSLHFIFNGSVPFVVFSGILCATIIREHEGGKGIILITLLGLLYFLPGIILKGTGGIETWKLLSLAGLLIFSYTVIQIIVVKTGIAPQFLAMHGRNTLTVFLLPFLMNHIIQATGSEVMFYKLHGNALSIAGSSAWTLLVLLLAGYLYKKGIRARL